MTEKNPMERAQYLKNLLQEKQQNHFRMEWEGPNIPRGGTINGIEIGWTQHGVIRGKGGETLGYYDREMKFGGEQRNKHAMIISTDYTDITPPPGGKVEPITKETGQGKGGRGPGD